MPLLGINQNFYIPQNIIKKFLTFIFITVCFFLIGLLKIQAQPNLSSPSVCGGFTSSDMTLTYNGSTGSCAYYTFSFTYDPDIIDLEWEIWSSGKNSYNSYMNYCESVYGTPADYTFSFKGWYLIRVIVTFSDYSTCQVYKYLNVNGSSMINCQPNPSEMDVARPRVNINYSDPCYVSSNIRGGLISFAGDPLAPCTDEAKISYYLNYIDCDGVTHCDVAIGYTQGYSSCFNIAFGTVFIIEALGNHCCYPDGFKRYKTIQYEGNPDIDTRPAKIIDNGNNCTDACTVWYSNCTTGNWFYVDSVSVTTTWNGSYPSSCSPYFSNSNNYLYKNIDREGEGYSLDQVRINENQIEFITKSNIESIVVFDLMGRKIHGIYNFEQHTYKLEDKHTGLIFICVKINGKMQLKKLFLH